MGEVLAKSTMKEESFCLARKDPFQTLSVEALVVGPASLSAGPAQDPQ